MKVVVKTSPLSSNTYSSPIEDLVLSDSSICESTSILALKKYITSQHPLHPAVESQKIVYYGRYWSDTQTLKELVACTLSTAATTGAGATATTTVDITVHLLIASTTATTTLNDTFNSSSSITNNVIDSKCFL